MNSLKYLLAWLLLIGTASAELGPYGGVFLGPLAGRCTNAAGGVSTQTFNAANTGWCARFLATSTKDITSVGVSFSAVSSPGTVTARIETVDATTGKPTGTLYDANATKQFTPSAGWNAVTFTTPPSTGMTAGTMYALVLLKDDAGTTCTLHRSVSDTAIYPNILLTASDGTTRSNFAEVNSSSPICYFTMEDGSIESLGCSLAASVSATGRYAYGTDRVIAQKMVLQNTVTVCAYMTPAAITMARTGTPAGDLRFRILDNTNTAVTGSTVTVDKDYLANVNARGLYVPFAPITLAPGTYRIAIDSASSADASNAFGFYAVSLPNAKLQGSNFCYSISTNASTSFTWTDTTTDMVNFGLQISDIQAGGSGTHFTPNLNGNFQ